MGLVFIIVINLEIQHTKLDATTKRVSWKQQGQEKLAIESKIEITPVHT